MIKFFVLYFALSVKIHNICKITLKYRRYRIVYKDKCIREQYLKASAIILFTSLDTIYIPTNTNNNDNNKNNKA